MYFNLTGNLQHANLDWSLSSIAIFKDPGDLLNWVCICMNAATLLAQSTLYLEYNVKEQVYRLS